MPRRIILSLALLIAQPLFSQTTEPTIHTAADLQQREAKLIETAKASPTGFAIGRLEDYGNDYTLLVVRLQTGEAERHQFFVDQIVINKGTITLVTGGTMQGEHPNNGPTAPAKPSVPASKAEKNSPSTPETSSTSKPASPIG